MSLEKRGILLQQIASYGPEGISKDILKKKLGWSDGEFNVAWQQAIAEKEVDLLPNGFGRLSDRLKGQVPELDAGEPVQTEVSGTFVRIDHSSNVIVNTGTITDSIVANASTVQQSGDQKVAEALRALAEAIDKSTEISKQQKFEALERLKEVSEQAALPPGKRVQSWKIKDLLVGISLAIRTAGGLAEVWHTWGPAISNFFGIQL
jgi:hypothetical protein